MDKGFAKVMANHSNEELVKIVTVLRADYQPLAIEAAEAEIRVRQIDTSAIEAIKVALDEKAREQKKLDTLKVSRLARFFHFIVDTIAFFAIAVVISLTLGVILGSSISNAVGELLAYVILISAYFGYYIVSEHKFQKTLGKFITRTKVVGLKGEKAALGDIVKRTFCRLIPFDRLFFIFGTSGLHDSFSNTMVIKDN